LDTSADFATIASLNISVSFPEDLPLCYHAIVLTGADLLSLIRLMPVLRKFQTFPSSQRSPVTPHRSRTPSQSSQISHAAAQIPSAEAVSAALSVTPAVAAFSAVSAASASPPAKASLSPSAPAFVQLASAETTSTVIKDPDQKQQPDDFVVVTKGPKPLQQPHAQIKTANTFAPLADEADLAAREERLAAFISLLCKALAASDKAADSFGNWLTTDLDQIVNECPPEQRQEWKTLLQLIDPAP
jgi:hypothetical protein